MEKSAASENTLSSLEFPAILDLLTTHSRTPYGRERTQGLRPSPNLDRVRFLLERTREMVLFRQSHGAFPLSLSVDVRPLLERLDLAGSLLAGGEIRELLEQAKSGEGIRASLARSEQPGHRQMARVFPEFGNLVRFLDGKISATGEIEDRCSEELLGIRRQIASQTERLEAALREIASRPDVARALQDTYVALRNSRHVLPVRIDAQGSIEGIVHALSSSGATVYIEPLSTVPLNNDLVRLREEEEVEIRRILLDFCDLLRSRLPDFHSLLQSLAEVDLVSAQAALAEEMGAVEPDLVGGPEEGGGAGLSLRAARHPVLERSLRAAGRPLVPLDLDVEPRHNALVLSGPNTGGKTVALKTVGLLAAMAQSGLHVPAASARHPVFRSILMDIGDHQSILESLSTFSARLENISAMARDLDAPGLVLLDEVGTGTDPEEGACLGVAIVDYFRTRGALVLATTHHQSLKGYAATTEGVANFSMDFDEKSLQPRYRLRAGVPGRSGGIDIAERLGLPDEIVRHARQLLPRQRELLDDYLKTVQRMQEDLEASAHRLQEEAAERLRKEKEREEISRRLALDREARFAQSLEEISARLEDQWNGYLREVTDREARSRLRREFERRETEDLAQARDSMPEDLLTPAAAPSSPAPAALCPGDHVRVPLLRVDGVVERVDGKQVLLRSGVKRLKVSREQLQVLEAPGRREAPSSPAPVRLSRPVPREFRPEINLIGKRVEEALAMLDKYLDDMVLAAAREARVVHGVGGGRLRAAIRRFLASHPHVEGFAEAPQQEGGAGATVVRLRD